MNRAGGGGGRSSKIPLPSSFDHSRRDSDVSIASSRPSSAGGSSLHPLSSALLSDRSSQSTALRAINSYLSSLSVPFSLRPPLPSARDITATLRLLLSRLDIITDEPISDNNLESELMLALKLLNCPVKLNRSALRAPGTPHSWPAFCSVIYWLVRLARYQDHKLSQDSSLWLQDNELLHYTTTSYSLYMSGEDDAVTEVDEEYLRKANHQAENAAAQVDELAKEVEAKEAKVAEMKGKPSLKEELEREKAALEGDERKFESVVEHFKKQLAGMDGKLTDLEKELEAKVKESERIAGENEDLKKTVEGQVVNVRDVERMRREMAAVERDIADSEMERNAMEEKAWEVDAEVGRKFKELEGMSEQCNQAVRK